MMKRKAKDNMSLWQVIKLNLLAVRMWYGACPMLMVTDIVGTVLNAIAPSLTIWLSARIVDELTGTRDPKRLAILILLTLGSNLLIALINLALDRCTNYFASEMGFYREKLYADKLLSMDFRRMDEQKTHDLYAQVKQHDNWGYTLERSAMQFNDVLRSFSGIAGVVVLCISMFTARVPEQAGNLTILNNPFFVLIIGGIMLAVTLFAPSLKQKGRKYWNRYAEESKLENNLNQFYGHTFPHDRSRAADIRLYRQDLIGQHYVERCDVYTTNSNMARYSRGPVTAYDILSVVCSYGFIGITYFIVCLKAWAGAFGVGYVTQYIGALTNLSRCISGFVDTFGQMHNSAPFLQTFFEFLDIPNDMAQGTRPLMLDQTVEHEIEFRDVSFQYPGTDAYALRHVNLCLHSGRKLAVVGRNGSGKTTFIKLLCRMYDPTEGTILLDGVDIREYDYRDYLRAFSVVFQDFKLFAFPLAQNVAAASEYDGQLVSKLLRQTGFGDRLDTMPDGIETYLYKDLSEKGVEVSGGEAQKIAIARALYKDAPFIILDEPTAALDPVAEYEIYTNFSDLVGDKTAIYISHRLSSCRFCDDIAVFEDGVLIEQGSHDVLVSNRMSHYYELWNAQAQYYE